MLDDALTGASTPLPHCMWCSAELPSDHETTCPTCGATLIGEGDNQVPGVTAIDAEAIIRAGRDAKPRQRSRLMSWLSGEYPEEDEPAPHAHPATAIGRTARVPVAWGGRTCWRGKNCWICIEYECHT